jgi:glycine oxidase
MSALSIAIRGAGVVGLWQALTLARRGHRVTLCERSPIAFTHGCSLYAGAMLAPDCERESAEASIRELGLRGVALWRKTYPGTRVNGTLVVALPRDRAELSRFARMTEGHQRPAAAEVESLEPALKGRIAGALFFSEEGHLATEAALRFLLAEVESAGVRIKLGEGEYPRDSDYVIDCRGLAAKELLPGLRGVRGERIVVKSREVTLSRPVRLLHPRFPLYIVPWGDGVYMIGATVIESEEAGPISLRSALDLLSGAYALDPAFPDNRPRITVRGRYILVNGLYRHGFLLAPVMADLVAKFIEAGATDPEVFVADPLER